MTSYTLPLLSGYPARKIRVGCDKCGLDVQYDRDGLLAAGGDRPLGDLLNSIARRHGCALIDRPAVTPYNKCGAKFPELADILKRARRQ